MLFCLGVFRRKGGSALSPLFVFPFPDKALALSQHPCGANISLDQGPAGSIHLTPPGRFNATNATSHGAPPPPACTWVLQVPPGRTVLLAPSGLERGWALAVGCVRDQDDHVLGSEGTVVLSRCDNDTATLSWRADGGSARSAGLRYYGRKRFPAFI